ncbi:putative beta-lysine N-acetyltransferase [Salibacterium aidingense]|uniref:putative beta-lysine N-acetyltransferase n=1 Tax=Salibacterium aidingense TaxID=384933 RepID=UPI003BEE1D23
MNILTERYSIHLKDHTVIEPFSQRIKVYALPPVTEMEEFLFSLKKLASDQLCDKLIFYVKAEDRHRFTKRPYVWEGKIKGFFQGKDADIYAWFLQPDRYRDVDVKKEQKVLKDVLTIPEKAGRSNLPAFYSMRHPAEADAEEMAQLYRSVFKTYPTPMHDPAFIRDVMKEQVFFTVVEYQGSIVSACSSDVLVPFQCAEMSDCATHPSHRNQGLLSYQFSYLIQLMQQKGLWTLFSYSRSLSLGMNMVNVYHGFRYGGKMIRNSNISGQLESMNVWYKQLRLS